MEGYRRDQEEKYLTKKTSEQSMWKLLLEKHPKIYTYMYKESLNGIKLQQSNASPKHNMLSNKLSARYRLTLFKLLVIGVLQILQNIAGYFYSSQEPSSSLR